jgi:hypothetical protein
MHLQLRILNLGSQFGNNEGSDAVGLTGTVPRQLSELKQLTELNLESNALTGELPETLCNGGESVLWQEQSGSSSGSSGSSSWSGSSSGSSSGSGSSTPAVPRRSRWHRRNF